MLDRLPPGPKPQHHSLRNTVLAGLAAVVLAFAIAGWQWSIERRNLLITFKAQTDHAAIEVNRVMALETERAEWLRSAFETEFARPTDLADDLRFFDERLVSKPGPGSSGDGILADRDTGLPLIVYRRPINRDDPAFMHELVGAMNAASAIEFFLSASPAGAQVRYLSNRGFSTCRLCATAFGGTPVPEQPPVTNLRPPNRRPIWTVLAPVPGTPPNDAPLAISLRIDAGPGEVVGGLEVILPSRDLGAALDSSVGDTPSLSLIALDGRRLAGLPIDVALTQLPAAAIGDPIAIDDDYLIVRPLRSAPWYLVGRINAGAVAMSAVDEAAATFVLALTILLGTGVTIVWRRTEVALNRRRHDLEAKAVRLERAKDAAETANRAKFLFLSSIGHEFRTALNAIVGFSELIPMMCSGAPREAVLIEYATYIREAGDRVLQLLNDFLDLAKAETDRIQLQETEVDTARLLGRCVDAAEPTFHAERVRIEYDVAANLPLLRGDEGRIRQIVDALIANAVKFTPAGGLVSVRAGLSGSGGIRITIADTSLGVLPEDLPKILSPYEQASAELSPSYHGSGLGLALARHLVRIHGGLFRIDSLPGQGTTATVEFPADRCIGAVSFP